MIIIGVITIISASILLIYLIVKKKIRILIIIIGIVIIISGILILTNSNTNQKQEKISQYPISGTFIVPAGNGPEETKAYVKRGERFWVASSSNIELLNCKNGQTVQITSNGWISPLVKKEGYLTFMKTKKKVEIHFKRIN